ncbi:MAG: hypothetical protein KTR26_08070 [Flammeovirgaceae bacterium]|nr:hypothetical protein [Flammeovirgaceae bacterium]
MKQETDYLKDISEIRSIMERSSRFISLSGLTGVFAGIYALIGAYVAYEIAYVDGEWLYRREIDTGFTKVSWMLILDGLIVLVLALATGIYFTARKAAKNNQKIWDKSSKMMILHLLIPLATGGCFSLILLYWGFPGMVAPITLIFYGLSLVNASKYVIGDIQYLGYLEIVLGLIASIFLGYGLFFWAIGFGVLHIFYGLVMYNKYERNKDSN